MGHERVGRLPRTQRWISIVASVAESPEEDGRIRAAAAGTLDNVRDRLRNVQRDPGVQAAFQYLVALAQPADAKTPPGVIDLRSNPSPLRLVASLNAFVDQQAGSDEYAALAKHAAADAVAHWTRQGGVQGQLFDSGDKAIDLWERSAAGGPFSEISRLFFANFVERYVKYFLDRELSASLPSVAQRERFDAKLSEQIARVSKHAFETSRITQSFAAGWYNKNARGRVPSKDDVGGFLAIAFGKIREELRREAVQ